MSMIKSELERHHSRALLFTIPAILILAGVINSLRQVSYETFYKPFFFVHSFYASSSLILVLSAILYLKLRFIAFFDNGNNFDINIIYIHMFFSIILFMQGYAPKIVLNFAINPDILKIFKSQKIYIKLLFLLSSTKVLGDISKNKFGYIRYTRKDGLIPFLYSCLYDIFINSQYFMFNIIKNVYFCLLSYILIKVLFMTKILNIRPTLFFGDGKEIITIFFPILVMIIFFLTIEKIFIYNSSVILGILKNDLTIKNKNVSNEERLNLLIKKTEIAIKKAKNIFSLSKDEYDRKYNRLNYFFLTEMYLKDNESISRVFKKTSIISLIKHYLKYEFQNIDKILEEIKTRLDDNIKDHEDNVIINKESYNNNTNKEEIKIKSCQKKTPSIFFRFYRNSVIKNKIESSLFQYNCCINQINDAHDILQIINRNKNIENEVSLRETVVIIIERIVELENSYIIDLSSNVLIKIKSKILE